MAGRRGWLEEGKERWSDGGLKDGGMEGCIYVVCDNVYLFMYYMCVHVKKMCVEEWESIFLCFSVLVCMCSVHVSACMHVPDPGAAYPVPVKLSSQAPLPEEAPLPEVGAGDFFLLCSKLLVRSVASSPPPGLRFFLSQW